MVLDEIVAFATGFGSSTHHTQSPKPRLNPTRPKPRLNTITPSLHHPTPTNHNPTLSNPHFIYHYPNPSPTLHPIHVPTKTFHLFIYPSIHTHPHTNTYTLTRSIINNLLTLYISIDILTFVWYNGDNGEEAFYMLNI